MGRPKTRTPLNVFLNGRLVGRLRRHASGALDFQYEPGWLAWEHALPVSLSLPLREDRYIGAPVLAVLDNLLPDSEPTRRRVAERVGADGYDAFSLLGKIGRDCVGALQFLPEGLDPPPAGAVAGRPIRPGEIARKLGELASAPLGLDDDHEFRISLAGAQEKTALLWWNKRWHVPLGMMPTTHIVKPQIGMLPNGIDRSDSVENEYLCLRLTAALGLASASVRIADFGKHRVLVVERFDRAWRGARLLRLPQEDCCQALSVPPTRKYEADGGPGIAAVLDLLKGSDDPQTDRRHFLKAQLVFWLLGATDGHAKNFSVFLRPGGRFGLTPLYDVMSAQPAADAGKLGKGKMKLALAVGDRRHYVIDEIVPRHFMQTAERSGLAATTVPEICGELVEGAESAIDATLTTLPKTFPASLAASILGGMRKRLKRLETVSA